MSNFMKKHISSILLLGVLFPFATVKDGQLVLFPIALYFDNFHWYGLLLLAPMCIMWSRLIFLLIVIQKKEKEQILEPRLLSTALFTNILLLFFRVADLGVFENGMVLPFVGWYLVTLGLVLKIYRHPDTQFSHRPSYSYMFTLILLMVMASLPFVLMKSPDYVQVEKSYFGASSYLLYLIPSLGMTILGLFQGTASAQVIETTVLSGLLTVSIFTLMIMFDKIIKRSFLSHNTKKNTIRILCGLNIASIIGLNIICLFYARGSTVVLWTFYGYSVYSFLFCLYTMVFQGKDT